MTDQGANPPNPEPPPANRPAIPVEIIQSPADAAHTEEREAKADEHDAKDLDAQVRAADAAEEQIPPAWFAAALAFLGTLLLYWNLREARKANAIAQAALVVARQADRPHMLVGQLKLPNLRFPEETLVLIHYQAKNWGKSPAFLRSIATEADIFSDAPGVPTYDHGSNIHHVLSEAGFLEFKSDGATKIAIPIAQRAKILTGDLRLLVYGRIEYGDVHNLPHVNRWAYLFVPGKDAASDSWASVGDDQFAAFREYT